MVYPACRTDRVGSDNDCKIRVGRLRPTFFIDADDLIHDGVVNPQAPLYA